MIKIPDRFGELISGARHQANLTQAEIAHRTGISRRRISDFETERRRPSEEEQSLLGRALGLSAGHLSRACVEIATTAANKLRRKFQPEPSRFTPGQDRPSRIRLAAARESWPRLVGELERRVVARPDYAEIAVFLRDAAFDSELEMLSVLRLLVAGAEPAWAPPGHFGFDSACLIDPETRRTIGHCKVPALVFLSAQAIAFPQLSFLVGHKAPRPDLLIGIRTTGPVRWHVVELDGLGHRDKGIDRSKQLSLPVLRFCNDDVVADDYVTRALTPPPRVELSRDMPRLWSTQRRGSS